MPTDYEIEIAKTLVEALTEYGLISHLTKGYNNSLDRWFYDNELNELGFTISHGVTKVCIGHDDLENWIIKVGYTNTRLDYATIEYENYIKALKAELSYYFPKTVFLGSFEGRDFYIQEWAACDEDSVTQDFCDLLQEQYDEDDVEYNIEELWSTVEDMEDDSKISLVFHDEKLNDFLNDNDINDLHSGNFGYVDGRMVIIDFSGWMG